MTARGYAIGLGAGTQAFTLGFGQAIVGVSELNTALLMGAGWALNLVVAEWAVARSVRSVRTVRRVTSA